MNPSGKVALITGGAGGLGQAFSRALVAAGAKVVVVDAQKSAARQAVQDLDAEFGAGKAISVAADVTDSSQLEAAFKAAKKTFNGLDIVINSAGIMKDNIWEKEIDINLKGVMNGLLLAFKHCGKETGGAGGVVVNVSSMAGLISVPISPVYCATKHAVVALTRSYGDDLHFQHQAVRVMALCPGAVDTVLYRAIPSFLLHSYAKPAWDLLAQQVKNPNKPEFMAEAVMKMIREGPNGSVWMANDGIVRLINFPDLINQ